MLSSSYRGIYLLLARKLGTNSKTMTRPPPQEPLNEMGAKNGNGAPNFQNHPFHINAGDGTVSDGSPTIKWSEWASMPELTCRIM